MDKEYRLKPRADGKYNLQRKIFNKIEFWFTEAVVNNGADAIKYFSNKEEMLKRETIYL